MNESIIGQKFRVMPAFTYSKEPGKKGREEEFLRWPKYQQLYINAFENMIKERIRRGKMEGSWRIGTTGKDVFNWWMEYDILPGQMDLFEEAEEDE